MTPETMPPLFHTAHMIHFLNRPLGEIYVYDPADDGPECEVITRILAGHPSYISGTEKQTIQYSRYLDVAALVLYNTSFAELSAERQAIVRQRISHTWRLF